MIKVELAVPSEQLSISLRRGVARALVQLAGRIAEGTNVKPDQMVFHLAVVEYS